MEAIFSPGLLGFQAGLVRKLLHWIFFRLDTANRAEKCWLISGQGLTLSMNACYLNRKLSFLRLESQHLHFEDKILDQVRFEGFPGTCASLGWMMMVPTILQHDLTSTLRNLWCNDAVASDDHVDDNDVDDDDADVDDTNCVLTTYETHWWHSLSNSTMPKCGIVQTWWLSK